MLPSVPFAQYIAKSIGATTAALLREKDGRVRIMSHAVQYASSLKMYVRHTDIAYLLLSLSFYSNQLFFLLCSHLVGPD